MILNLTAGAGLADAGQGVADEGVHNSGAAECGFELDDAGRVGGDVADDGRLGAEGVGAQGGEGAVGLVGGDDGDEAALAGDVHRVDAEQLAGAAHLGPDRDRVLADEHADVGRLGDLVEYGGDAAPGGVTERADAVGRGQQVGHEAVQGRGVRLDVRLDVEFAAGEHDRYAVVTNATGHDDRVSGAGQRDPELGRAGGDKADPGRVDVAAVGL